MLGWAAAAVIESENFAKVRSERRWRRRRRWRRHKKYARQNKRSKRFIKSGSARRAFSFSFAGFSWLFSLAFLIYFLSYSFSLSLKQQQQQQLVSHNKRTAAWTLRIRRVRSTARTSSEAVNGFSTSSNSFLKLPKSELSHFGLFYLTQLRQAPIDFVCKSESN